MHCLSMQTQRLNMLLTSQTVCTSDVVNVFHALPVGFVRMPHQASSTALQYS